MAANVSYQPLLTKDTDIVLPPRVSFDEVDIKAVRNHAEAAAEIRAALIWYENERRGLGRTLWDQLQQAIYFIAEHPAIGSTVRRAKVYGTVRPQLLFLRKYPLPIWPRNLHRAFRGIELEKDGGSDLELVFIDRL